MAESRLHLQLVCCLRDWAKSNSFLGSNPIVFVDSPDTSTQETPFVSNGYRADVYAYNIRTGREIIGEAKTPNDLDTKRSQKQLESFLLSAADNEGRAFAIATQWDYVRYADNLLKYLCSEMGITPPKYCVLDQFGHLRSSSHDWI